MLAGAAMLLLVVYFWAIRGVVCENNPDCLPGWWLPVGLPAGVLVGAAGITLLRRGR